MRQLQHQGHRAQSLTLEESDLPAGVRRGAADNDNNKQQSPQKWDVVEVCTGRASKGVTLPLTWPATAPHDVAMLVLTPAE